MSNRRKFIKKAALGTIGVSTVNTWSSTFLSDQTSNLARSLKGEWKVFEGHSENYR